MLKALEHSQQKGFSLIEILVSLLILSVGLLGIATAQVSSIKMNQGAYHRSQANILLTEVLDRMRLNRDAFLAGNYDDVDTSQDAPSAQACITSTTGCTEAQLAVQDIREFHSFSKDINSLGDNFIPYIPDAVVTITRDTATDIATVSISWQQEVWIEVAGKKVKNTGTETLSVNVRI